MAEAHPLDAAKQVFCLHFELVKADFVFLHAAIAEHFDLAAGHALGGEGVGIIAAWLFSQQHGEAGEIVGRRIGARQKGHEVGADRVGDPGLVTGDLVGVAIKYGAGAQAAEVGAGVRLCEDGCWQDFTAGDGR